MSQPTFVFELRTNARHFPIRVLPTSRLDDDELFELCARNKDLRIERTPEGGLVIMSPTGGETSRRNAALVASLVVWAIKDGTGVVFDSNGGFILPNGAERAPDASWVKRARWDALTPAQRERFPPLCPDFVAELRSPSDSLDDLHAKMNEYVSGGALLGWLLDPETRRVWVYAPDENPVCLEDPKVVTGGSVLPGLTIELASIW
jgi:Uma2 family endonuclease